MEPDKAPPNTRVSVKIRCETGWFSEKNVITWNGKETKSSEFMSEKELNFTSYAGISCTAL